MKILVVDDMLSMRHVMINMLKDIGYKDIDEATDGLHALKLLQKTKYDLVITDFHMPKLSGVELLKLIRNDKNLWLLPVLMVTCEDQRKQVETVIAAKVNGFIIKPFTTNTLIQQLDKIKTQCMATIKDNNTG